VGHSKVTTTLTVYAHLFAKSVDQFWGCGHAKTMVSAGELYIEYVAA